MQEKKIICTVCPLGCNITVCGTKDQIESIAGFSCKRGEVYARNEFTHPVRILTTTVKVEGAGVPTVPVRSAKPIPKELLQMCMEVINKINIKAPVRMYDVVVHDILGTGIDIVATCNAE